MSFLSVYLCIDDKIYIDFPFDFFSSLVNVEMATQWRRLRVVKNSIGERNCQMTEREKVDKNKQKKNMFSKFIL